MGFNGHRINGIITGRDPPYVPPPMHARYIPTMNGCGEREARTYWSMVKLENAAPTRYSNYLERTFGLVLADVRP